MLALAPICAFKQEYADARSCLIHSASKSMATSDVVLYTYWRSSCSWRVRIALQWKGVPYDSRFVNLIANGGEQHSADYIDVNPQKLVRLLRHILHATIQMPTLASTPHTIHPPSDPNPAHRRLQANPVPFHHGVSRGNTTIRRPRPPVAR